MDSLSPESVQAMQHLHGNRMTASFMTGTTGALSQPVQAKLTVTEAGDQFEQEADSVAKDVVSRMHDNSVQREADEEELQMKRDTVQREPEEEEPIQMKRDTVQREPQEEEELQMKRDTVQREPQEEEELQMKRDTVQREPEEEEPIQMKRDTVQREPEEEEPIQMKGEKDAVGGTTLAPDVEQSISQARSGGAPLDAGVREKMETHMGADFSGVRVHTGGETDQLTNTLQAKAFTTGQDVFFRSDQYRPGDRNGQELIAHELTHVIQQNPGVRTKSDK
jgi:outer membrane biosynthesis protein TonB